MTAIANARPPQLDPRRADPTGTINLRRRFIRDLNARFDAIAREIRIGVVDEDIFGLRTNAPEDVAPLDPNVFVFRSDPRKAEAFMSWLREQMDNGVLEVFQGPTRAGAEPWTNLYMRRAYMRGMEDAWLAAERTGLTPDGVDFDAVEAFRTPFHADRAALVFNRAFEDLRGVTQETSTQISRVLAQGIAEGVNPRELAKQMTGRISAIGKNRARILARTEIIRAHAEASLNTYEQLGIEGVTADVEWSTAGDDRVCPFCIPLDGVVFSLRDARGLLPRHPQCRCAWLPSDPKERRPGSKTGEEAFEDIQRSREASAGGSLLGWQSIPLPADL